MIRRFRVVTRAFIVSIFASLCVKRTRPLHGRDIVLAGVLGACGLLLFSPPRPAHAQRFAAFAFDCIGMVGEPTNYFEATAILERYKIVGTRVVLDKRYFKKISMTCTPGVNGGHTQSMLPIFLDTDGRVVRIDAKIYTQASGGVTVIHTDVAGNNFLEGRRMALPERPVTQRGEVTYLVTIPNPSFEP